MIAGTAELLLARSDDAGDPFSGSPVGSDRHRFRDHPNIVKNTRAGVDRPGRPMAPASCS
jgi:hypothetical protein